MAKFKDRNKMSNYELKPEQTEDEQNHEIPSLKRLLEEEALLLNDDKEELSEYIDVFNAHKQRFWAKIDEHNEKVAKFEELREKTTADLQELLDCCQLETQKLKKKVADHETDVADFEKKVKKHGKAVKERLKEIDKREWMLKVKEVAFENKVEKENTEIAKMKWKYEEREKDLACQVATFENLKGRLNRVEKAEAILNSLVKMETGNKERENDPDIQKASQETTILEERSLPGATSEQFDKKELDPRTQQAGFNDEDTSSHAKTVIDLPHEIIEWALQKLKEDDETSSGGLVWKTVSLKPLLPQVVEPIGNIQELERLNSQEKKSLKVNKKKKFKGKKK